MNFLHHCTIFPWLLYILSNIFLFYQGGQEDTLSCQIGRPLNSQESYKVSIEYDVRKIPAATPRLFWSNVVVQSNSEGSKDTDRTNDQSNRQKIVLFLVQFKQIIAQNANNMYQVFLFSVNFEIPLVTEADLQITGNNIENRMGYIENEKYLNKTFQHIYQVSKSLSTPISGVTLEVRN